MATCHPGPMFQHLRLQETSQYELATMNGVQGQKLLQQPQYQPHLLNWVYLAFADQNSAHSDQKKLFPAIWSNYPSAAASQTYLRRNTASSSTTVGACLGDSIGDLAEHFTELDLGERKTVKRPPSTYLCHLCFKKGHYIRDCPQVAPRNFVANRRADKGNNVSMKRSIQR